MQGGAGAGESAVRQALSDARVAPVLRADLAGTGREFPTDCGPGFVDCAGGALALPFEEGAGVQVGPILRGHEMVADPECVTVLQDKQDVIPLLPSPSGRVLLGKNGADVDKAAFAAPLAFDVRSGVHWPLSGETTSFESVDCGSDSTVRIPNQRPRFKGLGVGC